MRNPFEGNYAQIEDEEIPSLEGDAPQTFVEITINDLLEETLYNYRVKAVNDNEEKRGYILSFTTGDEGNDGGNDDGKGITEEEAKMFRYKSVYCPQQIKSVPIVEPNADGTLQ